MRLILTLPNGTQVPLTGPLKIEAHEGSEAVVTYHVKLGVERGTSSSAQSSAGGCTIVTPNRKTGYAIHLEVLPD